MLNTRLYEALSIFHFERTMFYIVNLIVSDLFFVNFVYTLCVSTPGQIQHGRFKPIFHLATSFAQHEAKTRIRQRDWLKLAGEKIRREQVRSVFCSREQIRQVENRLYKAGFPLANIFARSDFFPLSLSFRLKPSGTN